jgi:hypothetical protein
MQKLHKHSPQQKLKCKKVKLSLSQVVEVHRLVKC